MKIIKFNYWLLSQSFDIHSLVQPATSSMYYQFYIDKIISNLFQ